MRAVVTQNYGSGPTLVDIDTPTAGPGEIRVEVHASSLNGFDIALARGFLRGMLEHQFPVVFGRDFAGVVDQVGDGVSAFAPGDEVFGVVPIQPLRVGGFGEYVVVPADGDVARTPDGLDHPTAGALGLAGAAATGTLTAIAAEPGETVLVVGATGGVGAIAVQRLAAAGAVVLATASGDAEAEHVRSLGAHHVIDRDGDLVGQVRAVAGDGVAAALHYAGDPVAIANLVAPGGRLASLIMVSGTDAFAGRDLTFHPVVAVPAPALLATLGADAAAGRLRVPIMREYALTDAPAAFDDFAAGTLGKLSIAVK